MASLLLASMLAFSVSAYNTEDIKELKVINVQKAGNVKVSAVKAPQGPAVSTKPMPASVKQVELMDDDSGRSNTGVCRADLNADGTYNIWDFLAFQTLYSNGDKEAEFDGQLGLTFGDFKAFSAQWNNCRA